MKKLLAHHLLMVRPAAFGPNSETAESNAFQHESLLEPSEIRSRALAEFDRMVASLRERGIQVSVYHDTPEPAKSDAVFPNNWFSTHPNGRLILYPMMAVNRRAERQPHIINSLEKTHPNVTDLSHFEAQGRFLESTGCLAFDHTNRVAYAGLSPRTDGKLVDEVAQLLGYKSEVFSATDANGQLIYHTNVFMAVGPGFSVICLESIADSEERQRIERSLLAGGLEIIDISHDQVAHFCGNVIAVANDDGASFILMSQSAFDAFTPEQHRQLRQYGEPLPFSIPTIEQIGGGSVRCMVAEIW